MIFVFRVVAIGVDVGIAGALGDTFERVVLRIVGPI